MQIPLLPVAAFLLAAGTLASAQTPPGVKLTPNLEYARVDTRPLLLDLYVPEKAARAPVVLRLAHRREKLNPVTEKLLASGYAVALASWMPDDSTAIYAGFPRDFYACKAAVRHVRANADKLGVDGARIGLLGSHHAATLAALLATTGQVPLFEGRIGNHLDASSQVRAAAMIDGITDWRNAELYGDESVNDAKGAPYQFFSANVKEVPTLARQASAVNYVRPGVASVLTIDTNPLLRRNMYATWIETLKRAGASASLIEPDAAGGVPDEDALAARIAAFFDAQLKPAAAPPTLTPEQQVDALIKARLFKQARQIIDEQMTLGGTSRAQWRRLLGQIAEGQADAMAEQLRAARQARKSDEAARLMWSIKEIVTDPARLGQFQVEMIHLARDDDALANLHRQFELLNREVQRGDWLTAERLLRSIEELAALNTGRGEKAFLAEFSARYRAVRDNPQQKWPAGVAMPAWSAGHGRDLYGYWMDVRLGGQLYRLRYMASGQARLGSPKDEWGRQADEPEPRAVEITYGFWLGETPVTQDIYAALMGEDALLSFFRGPRLPVETVSYQHVANFLTKLGIGARLPTQAEWEYACRAGSTAPASGTGRLSDMAWFWDEAHDAGSRGETPVLRELQTALGPKPRHTHEVRSKLPNAWGLYDMQGNVWEWCQGTSPVHGRNWHPARGGGFNSIPESCRAARTAWLPTEHESWNIGFRLVLPAGRSQ